MNKEQFIKNLKRIQEFFITEVKISEALNLLNEYEDGIKAEFYLSKPISYMISSLEDAMQDECEYIQYYIYELDWGKNGRNCIIDNGKNVSLETPEQLYNYLKK